MRKVPKLRFREFSDEWEENKLEELTTYVDYRGKTPKKVERGILLVTAKNIKMGYIDYNISKEYVAKESYDEIMRRGKVKKGEVLLTTEAPLGNVAQIDDENIALAQRVIKFAGISLKIDNSFLKYRFITEKFQTELKNKAIGTTVLGIQGKVLHKLLIKYPLLQEQEKIANFLSSVDKKISLTEEKLELFREYKKGVMQKIFSQELRFKDSEGKNYPEWEEKKLGDIFERITEKNTENNTNVLTISAQYGLISQIDFFNKSVAGKDLSKYYLLKKDDFAYNKSYSNGYPFGAIKKLNKYEKGIVSTLYICFRLKNRNNIVDFFEQFFESKKIDKNIQDIAQEGARNHGLLNVNTQDFFDIYISVPLLEEQQKIADFLSSIDTKIENVEKELEGLKEFKKGLLQQMFV